jgi:hypothetical protein
VKRSIVTAAVAGALALGGSLGVLAGAGAASAASAPVNCGSASLTQTGQARETVTVNAVAYNLAAPNKVANGKFAVFKTAVNAASAMTYCNTAPSRTEIVIVGSDGLTYALTNRGGDRVFFEQAHGYASQLWTYAGTPAAFTFKNVKSGLSIRTPNAGPSNFGPVAAGASPTVFVQSAA